MWSDIGEGQIKGREGGIVLGTMLYEAPYTFKGYVRSRRRQGPFQDCSARTRPVEGACTIGSAFAEPFVHVKEPTGRVFSLLLVLIYIELTLIDVGGPGGPGGRLTFQPMEREAPHRLKG